VVDHDLHWPDAWNVGSRLYLLSFCAFDVALNVVVAEEEFHNFWLLLMSVLHDTNVCGGCSGFVALNNLSLVLVLSYCLLGEAGLC
jgi:hypothetical protein